MCQRLSVEFRGLYLDVDMVAACRVVSWSCSEQRRHRKKVIVVVLLYLFGRCKYW